MSDLQKNKQQIVSDLGQLSQGIVEIGKRYKDAQASGNNEESQKYSDQLKLLSAEADKLQSQFDQIAAEEEKPNLERISKLRQDLETPAQFYQTSSGGLPSGNINQIGMGTFSRMAPAAEVKQIQREKAAELYNLPVGVGGMESEKLPSLLTAKLSTLQDPNSQAALLKQTFGEGNVRPVNVGGKTEFLIRRPDGTTATTFEKGMAGLAGIATEVPVIASEIASFMGILGATKSPSVAVAGSAATGAAVGTGIDTALRLAYGMKPDVGNTLARRGTEAVVGAGMGAISDVAIPAYRAAKIPSPFENKVAQTLEQARERLMTAEQKLAASQNRQPREIFVPMGAKLAGQEGIEAQAELAGQYAGSNIASQARQTQEAALGLYQDLTSRVPSIASDFSVVAAQKQAQKKALADEISKESGRSKSIIESVLENKTTGPISPTETLGKRLLESVKQAEDRVIADRDAAYNDIFNQADANGFSVSADEMLDEVSRLKLAANRSGARDTAAIKGVIDRLEERKKAPKQLRLYTAQRDKLINDGRTPSPELNRKIAELTERARPLNSRDFDEFIRAFREARPSDITSGNVRDVFGRDIAKGLSEYRLAKYDSLPAQLADGSPTTVGDLFRSASDLVRNRQGYEGNLLGSILKEVVGEQSKTPTAIVNAVIGDPANVRRVTQSLRELGASDPTKAGEADQILGMLQLEYMNRIGIGEGGSRKVAANDDMLDSLFGSAAPRQKAMIDQLNRDLRNISKLDKPNLTLEELKRMGGALSENERKSLAKTIVKRMQLEQENNRLINEKIFALAKKGNFQNVDADLLSQAILTSKSPRDVQMVMTQLSKTDPVGRNLFKGDLMRNLLREFPGGTPTANAPFTPLFDTKKFIARYEGTTGVKSVFANNLELVLGKDQADQLYDIAKIYEANLLPNVGAPGVQPRMFTSDKGTTLGLPLSQMAESVRNRFTAAMLSSSGNMTRLRTALSRNALPGDVNKAYNEMARDMFLTRTGAEALSYQAFNDPEFSLELENMAQEFDKNQNLNPAPR